MDRSLGFLFACLFFFIIDLQNKADQIPIIIDSVSEGIFDNVWLSEHLHQTDLGCLLKM